jgi:hypothetical protein
VIHTAHITERVGKQSELRAIDALMSAGWETAEPTLAEAYDVLAKNPRTNVWVRIQVKTVRVRDDREGSPLVVYAKRNNGKIYTEKDCEYFVGVHGNDVYLIANRRLTEYWKSDNPRKGYEWVLLTGDNEGNESSSKNEKEAV